MPKSFEDWEKEIKDYPPKEGPLYKQISSDFRFPEVVRSCLRCGTCTSICPAASFYDYSPREIIRILMDGVDREILELCKEKIYHCAQCHYCVVHCPRRNQPAIAVMILREKAHEWGLTTEAMRPFTRVLKCLLTTGTQLAPDMIQADFFPDWGPKTKMMGKHTKLLRQMLGENPEDAELKGVELLSGVEAAWCVDKEAVRELQKIWKMDGSLKRVGYSTPFLEELIEEELEEEE